MSYFPTIRGSLVVISITAIALILWLSGSFWYGAYMQRLDAVQLLQSIEIEELLFESSRDLAKERSMVHLMLSDADAVEHAKLVQIETLRDSTDERYKLIRKRINFALSTNSLSDRFTFVSPAIEEHVERVQHQLDRLTVQRELATKQASVSFSSRDNSIKAAAFKQFTTLIDSTQLLRMGVHFTPRYNELDIRHLQLLRSATWQFSEAIAKEAALLSGVIASGTYLGAKNLQEVELLHIETLSSWQALQRYMNKRGANAKLTAAIAEIEVRYFTEFTKLRHQIVADYQRLSGSSITLDQWSLIEDRSISQLDQLHRMSTAQIRQIASDVEAHGLRRLVVDSAIVLLCLIIGVAVLGVLRKIQHLATHDALTGLPNRIRFESLLHHAVNNADGIQIAVMFADLDGFKNVNDMLGHEVGDHVLQNVADRMKACVGESGIAARFGGDEFAIILHKYNSEEAALDYAENLVGEISREFQVNGFSVRIGASIGVSFFPKHATTAGKLKRNADFAMYHAKAQGRNCVRCFDDEIATKYQRRTQLKIDLKKSIDEQYFELDYQPQIGAVSQVVEGVEALIRLRHPERGLISPAEFIPIAEESGLILEIGDWVLDEACRQMSIWHKCGLQQMQVAVNVSAVQFMRPNFVEFVKRTCQKHAIPTYCLELEITESVLVTDVELVIDTCQQLRDLKIKIAIDDFGTGYSSLSYLQDLPVDTLKIDRSFVSRLDKLADKSVAKTIVMLAQSCGLKTVAEGVETIDQLNIIRDIDCDYIQGFYYSKPVASNELPQRVIEINEMGIYGQRAA